jgi:hypothetical protein
MCDWNARNNNGLPLISWMWLMVKRGSGVNGEGKVWIISVVWDMCTPPRSSVEIQAQRYDHGEVCIFVSQSGSYTEPHYFQYGQSASVARPQTFWKFHNQRHQWWSELAGYWEGKGSFKSMHRFASITGRYGWSATSLLHAILCSNL